MLALILRPVVSALELRLHGRRLTAVLLLYGGFVLGAGAVYYDSITMFVFFLLCGRFLEMRARQKAAASLEYLDRALPLAAAERHVHDVLNVFMCTGFTRDTQRYFMKASPVRPGDFLELFAEIDLLGALSACPGGDCSTSHSSDAAACHPLREIGRASCRERV